MTAATTPQTRSASDSRRDWHVRRAAPVDAAAIWAIHSRAIARLATADYTPEQIAAWTGRSTPASYAQPIAQQRVVVAVDDDGHIVGFAQIEYTEGTIEAVYTDPDHVRTGVGRALVAALEANARRHRLDLLSLEASRNSVPFYRALGYAICGHVRQPLGGGVNFECDVMTKRLDSPAAP